ncbi:MAG TPA: HYR domain-containing protein [Conexibacter sp.]
MKIVGEDGREPSHEPARAPRRAAAVVAALALPLVAASPALAEKPAGPLASRPSGRTIARAQIAGDGFDPTLQGTGSGMLIGGGVNFFVNAGITFSTASSASGAMSEASMTASRTDVSTASGGTTATQLNDAFDGYNALAVHIGDNAPSGPAQTGDPNYVIYSKNGAGGYGCDDREVEMAPQLVTDGVSSVTMSRSVWVGADAPVERTLDVFENIGTTPVTLTAYAASNLGSDSNTRITGSSSGDLAAGLDDTWVGTFQAFSGTTSSDPRLAHVLQGPGADVRLRDVAFADGSDNPTWDYQLTLQPGETRAIANYVVVEANQAAAAQRAAAIVADPPTDCMTDPERAELANFNLDKTAPTLSLPSTQTVTASGDDGAVVDFTATANDDADGSVPVTCTPASGGVFPVGTTTVTCTATDRHGNVATGSFDVVVAAAPPVETPPASGPPAPQQPATVKPKPVVRRAPRLMAPRTTSYTVGPRCSTPVGGKLPQLVARYRLSAAATVTYSIQTRPLAHPWTRCPKPLPAGSSPPARDWRTLTSVKRQERAGQHTIAFMRRALDATQAQDAAAIEQIGKVSLKPGSYRLVIVARNKRGTDRNVRNFVVLVRPTGRR